MLNALLWSSTLTSRQHDPITGIMVARHEIPPWYAPQLAQGDYLGLCSTSSKVPYVSIDDDNSVHLYYDHQKLWSFNTTGVLDSVVLDVEEYAKCVGPRLYIAKSGELLFDPCESNPSDTCDYLTLEFEENSGNLVASCCRKECLKGWESHTTTPPYSWLDCVDNYRWIYSPWSICREGRQNRSLQCFIVDRDYITTNLEYCTLAHDGLSPITEQTCNPQFVNIGVITVIGLLICVCLCSGFIPWTSGRRGRA